MRSETKGFTLIELAIVLVIIGFALASGSSLLALAVKKKSAETDSARLVSAKNSLFSYSNVNGVLPVKEGFAPAVSYSHDFGGRSVAYIYDEALTSNDAVCRRKTASFELRRCRNAGCTDYTAVRNIAFVTAGGGANANIQTGADEAGIIRIYIQGDAADDYPADGTRIEAYDDITEWVTLGELQARSGCAGQSLRILNNELPQAYTGRPYEAKLFADGGVPHSGAGGRYRWCLDDTPLKSSASLEFSAKGSHVTASSDCRSESESAWTAGDNVSVIGTPPSGSGGSYYLSVWVRDGNDPDGGDDSIANKKLVLTISE
ncbi:type II secretion system protein [Geovibrio thiophilus]|uniref:Type II secretion system protein n=1 Tax=Geovibrio thiophilus TaxID=139438 RepID=A0A3R5V2G7_9BACT|nr:type II secretion system protein [Geovibrio thiophilus]QAR33955.1 type II secretion system protein [Geovibrio thiophilus]